MVKGFEDVDLPYSVDVNGFVDGLRGEGLTYDEFDRFSDEVLSSGQKRWLLEKFESETGLVVEDEVFDSDSGRKRFKLSESGVGSSSSFGSDGAASGKRLTQGGKQSISNEASKYLKSVEEEVKPLVQDLDRDLDDCYGETSENGFDVVLHETDVHFGDVVKDRYGDEVYNSELAQDLTHNFFDNVMGQVDRYKDAGYSFDGVHLLLGGDLVTNEAIYSEQPHHIDETIDEQMNRATATYISELERLSESFDWVNVVCVGGNHGEFRVKGSSSKANADDLVYDRLELMSESLGMDNVGFVKSDRSDNAIFELRGGEWTGYLTHGENRLAHVGTSSPKSDWLSLKDEYGFDAAWRGHYHDLKEERVNDARIFMTPSRKPPGDFEDSLGVYGDPLGVMYLSSDELPVSDVKYVPVENPELDSRF